MLSYWVDDDDFDIERHVVREKLVRRRGQSERDALQARASELAATPLDHAHPLWQMHVFEHYEDGSAVIMRIHHCIADGIALNAVLMSVVDGGIDLRAGSAPKHGHGGSTRRPRRRLARRRTWSSRSPTSPSRRSACTATAS